MKFIEKIGGKLILCSIISLTSTFFLPMAESDYGKWKGTLYRITFINIYTGYELIGTILFTVVMFVLFYFYPLFCVIFKTPVNNYIRRIIVAVLVLNILCAPLTFQAFRHEPYYISSPRIGYYVDLFTQVLLLTGLIRYHLENQPPRHPRHSKPHTEIKHNNIHNTNI